MRKILLPLLLIITLPALAGVQSETVFFLQPDGRSYLLERSIHSNSPTHRFHLDKRIHLDDIHHISPARFEWDDSDERVNSLTFEAGGFTIIYPDRFNDSQLRQDQNGVLHYKSWDGRRNSNGRYGYWYAPGQFDQFSYTWIVPDNIKLLRYRSNQDGTWTRRNNAISFYAEKVNDLTFEMSYQVRTPAAPPQAVKNAAPTPPPVRQSANKRPSATPSPRTSWPGRDDDQDGIGNTDDLCPGTPARALVDKVGCALDTDRDGIPDRIDQCIATEAETPVDSNGCKINVN